MGLIDEIRYDIGDVSDTGVYTPSQLSVSTPIDNNILLFRTDIGDVETTGTFSFSNQASGIDEQGPVVDFRSDIGDLNTTSSSGYQVSLPVAAVQLESMIPYLRVDIGDEGDLIEPSGVYANSPAILGTKLVTEDSYDVDNQDTVLLVSNSNNGPTTINLPTSPINGKIFIIKDLPGTASINNITVNPLPNTIDGFTTLKMVVNKQSVTLMWSGGQWIIV